MDQEEERLSDQPEPLEELSKQEDQASQDAGGDEPKRKPQQTKISSTPVRPIKKKSAPYARITNNANSVHKNTDSSNKRNHSEAREWWGNNVKGKKFRKEKGKKKRCPNSVNRIDGAVRSFRFDK